MTSAKRIFVDTNILIQATIDSAPLHQEARVRLDDLWGQGAILFISHQVIREYVANTTRPQVYSPPLSREHVLKQVEQFRHTFRVLPDTPEVLLKLLEMVKTIAVGGKQVHDANIVATMLVHDIDTLLTHNVVDFERYNQLITLLRMTD